MVRRGLFLDGMSAAETRSWPLLRRSKEYLAFASARLRRRSEGPVASPPAPYAADNGSSEAGTVVPFLPSLRCMASGDRSAWPDPRRRPQTPNTRAHTRPGTLSAPRRTRAQQQFATRGDGAKLALRPAAAARCAPVGASCGAAAQASRWCLPREERRQPLRQPAVKRCIPWETGGVGCGGLHHVHYVQLVVLEGLGRSPEQGGLGLLSWAEGPPIRPHRTHQLVAARAGGHCQGGSSLPSWPPLELHPAASSSPREGREWVARTGCAKLARHTAERGMPAARGGACCSCSQDAGGGRGGGGWVQDGGWGRPALQSELGPGLAPEPAPEAVGGELCGHKARSAVQTWLRAPTWRQRATPSMLGDGQLRQNYAVDDGDILFEESVLVSVKRQEREEKLQELVIRILQGHDGRTGPSAKCGFLKIQLTSEEDPFFLHTLEVTEEEFQALKAEQSIRVDFRSFPSQLIELLNKCIQCQEFDAVLLAKAGESVFSVVETNEFKHLSHLSLQFRPGNDPAVKQLLSARLYESKTRCAKLLAALSTAENELQRAQASENELSKELQAAQGNFEKQLAKLQNAHAVELNTEREKSLSSMRQVTSQQEEDRRTQVREEKEKIRAMESKIQTLEGENKELRESKSSQDARVAELSAQLGQAEGALRGERAALAELRGESKRRDADLHESQQLLNQQLIKVSALERQTQDKDDVIMNLKVQLQEEKEQKDEVERELRLTKQSLEKAEELAEAHTTAARTGDQAMEKVQAELRSSKSKLKLKTAMVTHQEGLLQERQEALEKAMEDARKLMEKTGRLERTEEEMKGKLDESQKLLQQNQQMIQWLNGQLNGAPHGRIGGPTRFAYRPSTPAVMDSSFKAPLASAPVDPEMSPWASKTDSRVRDASSPAEPASAAHSVGGSIPTAASSYVTTLYSPYPSPSHLQYSASKSPSYWPAAVPGSTATSRPRAGLAYK
eukprot:scaffold3446_cov393-Prasinococcus_capsulatus_cf.AAC.5